MDGVNITQALDKNNAIQIDPNYGVISKIEYLVTGNHSVEASHLTTVFVIADLDATSQSDNIEVMLSPGDNFTFVQTWKFNNYIGLIIDLDLQSLSQITGTVHLAVLLPARLSMLNPNLIVQGTHIKKTGKGQGKTGSVEDEIT